MENKIGTFATPCGAPVPGSYKACAVKRMLGVELPVAIPTVVCVALRITLFADCQGGDTLILMEADLLGVALSVT